MHSAQTLDAKIGALTAAVGDLQGEVQAALATLRAAGNVAGTLSYLSRVTLLLMRRLFGAAGQQAPSDNLNAMQWCREAQRHERQGRLALAIGRFLLRRGSLDEALRSLEWGLEAAPQVPEEATRLYAQLLLEGAGLHLDTHEWAAARARALDALALFETSGDIVGQADTQNLLGLAARGARDYPEASRYFAQAYTAYERAAGQTGETGVANALNNLGITEDEAGCKQKATAHLQAALALRRRQGDMRGTAETLNNLGALAKDQNQLEEARQFYAEALQFEQALRYDIVEHGSTVFVEVRLLNHFVAGVKVGSLDFMAMRVVGKSGFSVSMFCMESEIAVRTESDDPQPLAQPWEGQLLKVTVDTVHALAAMADFMQIHRYQRCRYKLYQGLEQVEGVIMPTAWAFVVVRPVV